MITWPHAEVLAKELGEGVKYVVFDDKGHVLFWEAREDFTKLMEDLVDRTARLDAAYKGEQGG